MCKRSLAYCFLSRHLLQHVSTRDVYACIKQTSVLTNVALHTLALRSTSRKETSTQQHLPMKKKLKSRAEKAMPLLYPPQSNIPIQAANKLDKCYHNLEDLLLHSPPPPLPFSKRIYQIPNHPLSLLTTLRVNPLPPSQGLTVGLGFQGRGLVGRAGFCVGLGLGLWPWWPGL